MRGADMKKLSIITPLYNTQPRFLNDVIASVSDYGEDVELVLVNDSPEDLELSSQLKQIGQLPFVRIIKNECNLGIFRAYYNGFLNATGEYCCILDHDDVFDPQNVLREIEKKPDMIYTNEYKYSDNLRQKRVVIEKYMKPEFDFLSAVFYLYTHHVTVLKTRIIQAQLRRHRDMERYTSVFDIHMSLEYIAAFAGKDMKVIHIPSEDYGWRVHENSTAYRLDQKLTGYFERVRKTDEFLRRFGETPLLRIDEEIGYLVVGEFLSLHDMSGYPMRLEEFSTRLKAEGVFRGKELCISWEGKEISDKTAQFYHSLLTRIPARYLLAQRAFPIVIPEKDAMKTLDPENMKLHVHNVPFLSSKKPAKAGLMIYQVECPRPKIGECTNYLIKRKD